MSERSGGTMPKAAFATAGSMAVVMVSPIFSAESMRLARICGSVRPRSSSRA
jgi:hypothetical protein